MWDLVICIHRNPFILLPDVSCQTPLLSQSKNALLFSSSHIHLFLNHSSFSFIKTSVLNAMFNGRD